MEYIKICVGAAVLKEDKILLVKRKNPPERGLWSLPGGKVKFGESLKKAVKREVFEETHIEVEPLKPIYTFEIIVRDKQNRPIEHFVIIDFFATYKSGEIIPGDDALDAMWVGKSLLREIALSKYTKEFFGKWKGFPLEKEFLY
jgi:ADP-ribose pyrophosphatase YjhB (NUDIX family)